MTITMPVPDVHTILDKTNTGPPQKCHTVDARGWAICGAFGPRHGNGAQRDAAGLHTRAQCAARGHRHCVECDELQRQLGDDGLMAA